MSRLLAVQLSPRGARRPVRPRPDRARLPRSRAIRAYELEASPEGHEPAQPRARDAARVGSSSPGSASRASTSRASRSISTASLTYAGLLPRPVSRRARRGADRPPVRRPLPAAAGRAPDRRRPDDDLPDRSRPGAAPGALDRRRARPLRGAGRGRSGDYRVLDGFKYILGVAAIVLLVLPAIPGLGATINGATLWVRLGPIAFQPGELAKVLLVVFLAGYLRDKREVLSRGLGRVGIPSPKHVGPLLAIWGGAMLVLVPDERSRRRAPLLLGLPRHALRGHRPLAVRRRRARPLRGRRLRPVPRRPARRANGSSIWLDPWSDPHGQRLPARPVDLLARGRGAVRNRPRPGGAALADRRPVHPVPRDRLHLLGARAGARARRRRGHRAALRGARLPGLRIAMLADDGFSKLLATGLTVAVAHPGVHHPRRRHRPDPADRDHAAVRLLRRLEHRRELPRALGSCSPCRIASTRGWPADERRRSAGCSCCSRVLFVALVAHVDVLALAGARPRGAARQPEPRRAASSRSSAA